MYPNSPVSDWRFFLAALYMFVLFRKTHYASRDGTFFRPPPPSFLRLYLTLCLYLSVQPSVGGFTFLSSPPHFTLFSESASSAIFWRIVFICIVLHCHASIWLLAISLKARKKLPTSDDSSFFVLTLFRRIFSAGLFCNVGQLDPTHHQYHLIDFLIFFYC